MAAQSDGNERWPRELELLRRLRRNALALPQDLVRHFANARSQSLGAWEEARDANDFALFARPFDRLLSLMRERAAGLCAGGDPYDALLDEHEHGMTRSRLDPVLDEVRKRLVPMVKDASAATASSVGLLNGRRFAENRQWELCRQLLTSIGFEFERGRLDRSTHPFTLSPAPTTCASPSAWTRTICRPRSSPRCMKAATVSTIRASIRTTATRSSAKRPAWACTNASRACGRTMSGAASPSGVMRFRFCGNCFPMRPKASTAKRSIARSTSCGRASTASPRTRCRIICTSCCVTSWRWRCSPARLRSATCPRHGTSAAPR